MSVKSSKVNTSEEPLNDWTNVRLERAGQNEVHNEVHGADWDYGTNVIYLSELLNYRREKGEIYQ